MLSVWFTSGHVCERFMEADLVTSHEQLRMEREEQRKFIIRTVKGNIQ